MELRLGNFLPSYSPDLPPHVVDLNYTFTGKILADGGLPITRLTLEIAENMPFRNAKVYLANVQDGNFSVNLALEKGKRYFYRATATNEEGTSRSASKILETSPTQTYWWSNYPAQTGGWRTSTWFGTFRPYDNGWIYHHNLGWVYAQSEGIDGFWLWIKDKAWIWTSEKVYPYFWKNNDGTWHYLIGSRNSIPFFQEWKENFSQSKQ